jgi:hypothetical protein
VSGRPALPCPPWCSTSHEGEFVGRMHSAIRDFGNQAGWVQLIMTDYGDEAPVLSGYNGQVHVQVHWRLDGDDVRSVERPLGDAAGFAEMAEALGRPAVAELIRELASLAAEEDSGA